MTFTAKHRIKLSLLLVVLTQCVALTRSVAQAPVENAVFWEVSGKGLAQPSYLFGTFHLIGSRYTDSLTQVMKKFESSKAVVGELLMDSTLAMRMMMGAQMKGTTLDKVLSEELYKNTAAWLKEVSGYDLKMLNTINPMTVQIFIMTMLQQKYFPLDAAKDIPMDLYFQQRGKTEGKKVAGLESLDVQLHALFNQFTYARQAELLAEFVNDKPKAKDELVAMNKLYREANLSKLQDMMSSQTYSKEEQHVMLDDRNTNWMQQLPAMFKEQPTFVAVGALHLAGDTGLVALLRKAGYTVKPLATK